MSKYFVPHSAAQRRICLIGEILEFDGEHVVVKLDDEEPVTKIRFLRQDGTVYDSYAQAQREIHL